VLMSEEEERLFQKLHEKRRGKKNADRFCKERKKRTRNDRVLAPKPMASQPVQVVARLGGCEKRGEPDWPARLRGGETGEAPENHEAATVQGSNQRSKSFCKKGSGIAVLYGTVSILSKQIYERFRNEQKVKRGLSAARESAGRPG